MELNKIINEIDEYGYSVINSFYGESEVEQLRNGFEVVINDTALQTDYSIGKTARLTSNISSSRQRDVIRSMMRSKLMQKIAAQCFHESFELNGDIFLSHDVKGIKHIAQDLHFDIIPTLKFFLYLNDTNEENGAIRLVPGSHHWTKDFRKKNSHLISFKNREISRKLPDLGKDIPICGNAGDLIIFNSETFHRAGTVEVGERMVIRGHTRSKSAMEQNFHFKVASPSLIERARKFIGL